MSDIANNDIIHVNKSSLESFNNFEEYKGSWDQNI